MPASASPPLTHARFSFSGRMKTDEELFFIQQLSLMLKVGISVTKALKFLGDQQRNPAIKIAILDAYDDVTRGNSLEASLARYPRIFNADLVSLVRVGELRGDLPIVLDNYYLLVKRRAVIRKKLQAALIYPTVVIVSMVVLGGLATVFIFPQIEALFSSVNLELPPITRAVIGVAHFTHRYGYLIFGALAAALVGLFVARRTVKGRRFLGAVILHIPLASTIVKESNVAQIMRNMAVLHKSGMSILDIIDTTAKACSQESYRRSLIEAREQVSKGNTLSQVLRDFPRLYPMVPVELIAVGEETGRLNEVCEQIADFYEDRVFGFLDALPGLLEPILIFSIGAGVAVIALAILLPMYSLSSSI